MPKARKDAAVRSGTDIDKKKRTRRLSRLARRLDAVHEAEARRSRRVAEAHDRGASELVARRARQLEKTRRRRASLEAEIASLIAAVPTAERAPAVEPEEAPAVPPEPAPVAAVAVPAVRGYCLRERRAVEIVEPRPFVMRNGRSGIAGTCPGCGTKVARPGRL